MIWIVWWRKALDVIENSVLQCECVKTEVSLMVIHTEAASRTINKSDNTDVQTTILQERQK
jgi:hypothetical protein